MIPVGYIAKRVIEKPEWIKTTQVKDIYSVSSCGSPNFVDDYIKFWKHNGYWFFNSPKDITELSKAESISLDNTKLFYYEMYEKEFDGIEWKTIVPKDRFKTSVETPRVKKLEGYDIVTFSMGNRAECSPLSCNSIADSTKVNSHCLLESFEEAITIIESPILENCEPGPERIFAVYSLS
jgi:hypothetical protein